MRRKRKKNYERHNVWRSYSDMLSGLLLLFILVMCISFMQAQKNYQDRLAEQAAHMMTQEELNAQLSQRESEIAAQQATLDEQAALLATQESDLAAQGALLLTQQQDLDAQSLLVAEQESELEQQSILMMQQQSELDQQNLLMLQQQSELDSQAEQLAIQQMKIEQIIGIKAELIADLKEEFDREDVAVTIDETDGSIALDSSVLFEYNMAELTDEGKEVLDQVLPIYFKVIMSEKYRDYMAEVRIDGYTDTDGEYMYNMELSQKRSLAVANYLINDADSFLDAVEYNCLREKLTANGHSMNDPVYDANGEIDMEASRRVEIKFRLKDEEMINELQDILDTQTSEGETSVS